MNAVKHCKISVRRWGGVDDDYLALHDFIDHTKVFCADARHRILHTHWALNHIVVPIFGHTLVNSEGHSVNVKDLCERDHLLVDYQNKFIPTLSDFIEAIIPDELPTFFEKTIEKLHGEVVENKEMSELMLSPLAYTGRLESLLVTHNSWFIQSILPQIFDTPFPIRECSFSPSMLFNAMEFELWMDNGMVYPNSAKKLEKKLVLKGHKECKER